MKHFAPSLYACFLTLALGCVPHQSRADGLSTAVKQQVAQTATAWAATGDTASLSASITDLCSENPGIAPDIVAYAGEIAARTAPPERCLVSDSMCPTLEDLLAVLYEHAIKVNRGKVNGGKVVALPSPAANHPPDHGSNPPPACQISGTCVVEPPPVSATGI